MKLSPAQLKQHLQNRPRRALKIAGFRQAAVLVAITDAHPAQLILTVRSSELPTHKGQISFPGGKLETGESIEAGALREAFEEIGLEPSAVQILGWLDDVFSPFRFQATPVVALIPANTILNPHSSEVAEILRVPLKDLRQLTPRKEWRGPPERVLAELPAGLFRGYVTHYDWHGHDIWGMTAWVIENLLEVEASDVEKGQS